MRTNFFSISQIDIHFQLPTILFLQAIRCPVDAIELHSHRPAGDNGKNKLTN